VLHGKSTEQVLKDLLDPLKSMLTYLLAVDILQDSKTSPGSEGLSQSKRAGPESRPHGLKERLPFVLRSSVHPVYALSSVWTAGKVVAFEPLQPHQPNTGGAGELQMILIEREPSVCCFALSCRRTNFLAQDLFLQRPAHPRPRGPMSALRLNRSAHFRGEGTRMRCGQAASEISAYHRAGIFLRGSPCSSTMLNWYFSSVASILLESGTQLSWRGDALSGPGAAGRMPSSGGEPPFRYCASFQASPAPFTSPGPPEERGDRRPEA
jgi:hypothetical protein